ncbi:MAG: DUF3017 domain-containing protein [Nakamurella sp.]
MITARWRRAIPITVVLVIAAIGLLLFATAHWRRGSALLGASALVGAGLRAFVPDPSIGVLAVRGRTFDVIFMLALAAGFAVLVLVQ